jgi:hypothetical protein
MPSRTAAARAASIGMAAAAWSGPALAQVRQTTRPTPTQGAPTHTTTTWFASGHAWAWAVGIAVFLIVVIALTTRSGRNA